jgi:hypothetical protein
MNELNSKIRILKFKFIDFKPNLLQSLINVIL